MQVSDEDAYHITRQLAKLEGILVGPSSGAACYAAIETAKQLPADQIVICMTADTGERYLSSDVFKIKKEQGDESLFLFLHFTVKIF